MNRPVPNPLEVILGVLFGILVFAGLIQAISGMTYNPKSESDKPYFVYQGY